MKTIKFYLAVLAAFALVACTDDHLETNKPIIEDDGMLTFVFPDIAKGSTTYAVGSAEENKLETLDIYVFTEHPNSADNPKPMVLEEVFLSGTDGFDFQTSGNDKIAKIKVPAGDKKHFFFIANGRKYHGQNAFKLFETTAESMMKLGNSIAGSQHIVCPLEMSTDTLVDMTILGSPATIDVELTRRVARFDVKNDSDDSGFIVDEILIFNAPAGANVFAKQDAIQPYTSNVTPQLDPVDFSIYPNSNHGTSSSVFYLCPTLATDPGTSRELKFELVGRSATSNSPQIYPVKLEKPDGTPIKIDANHLYTIHILNMGIGYINATLEVKEWTHDPDNDIDDPTGYGTIKLKDEDGNPIPNGYYSIQADDITEHTFLVEADTEWEIVVGPQYYWIEHNGAEMVEDKVYKEFKIKATSVNPSGTTNRSAVIIIQNKNRPSIAQKFVLRQLPNLVRYINVSSPFYTEKTFATGRFDIPGEMTKPFAVNVDVLAGTDWAASASASTPWLQFAYDPDPAQGPGKLLITPIANTTSQSRVDTLTIETLPSDPSEKLVLKIPVIQAVANLGDIRVDAAGLNTSTGEMSVAYNGFPDANGNKRMVKVFAHTDWEVTSSESWAEVSDESKGTPTGDYNGSFRIFAQDNNGAEREATITIKNKQDAGIFAVIKLIQAADPGYTPTP